MNSAGVAEGFSTEVEDLVVISSVLSLRKCRWLVIVKGLGGSEVLLCKYNRLSNAAGLGDLVPNCF